MSANFHSQGSGTFMLEPRDESLMRKKKVIEILKTFQEPENDYADIKKQKKPAANFGEQFNPVGPGHKKKSHSSIPSHTYYTGKPIII